MKKLQKEKNLEEPEENRSDEVKDTSPEDEAPSDEDTDSNGGQEEWQREFEEGKKVAKDQWQAFETGDMLAEPHSVEWNKSNFFNSRHNIELLQRRDGKPLKPGEIHYTVAATPLDNTAYLNKSSRIVLVDLGFACAFDECEQLPLAQSIRLSATGSLTRHTGHAPG
jgi:hypothetical protein